MKGGEFQRICGGNGEIKVGNSDFCENFEGLR